jgi:hypothetical protein
MADSGMVPGFGVAGNGSPRNAFGPTVLTSSLDPNRMDSEKFCRAVKKKRALITQRPVQIVFF